MAAQVSDTRLSQIVSSSIQDGRYPEDEAYISAELSSDTLESLSQLLNQARDEVKHSIRELSRLHAEDVDQWITEAKQLRHDLQESQQRSAEMRTLSGRRQELENTSTDAVQKVKFLKRELVFNDKLTNTLENALKAQASVNAAQASLMKMDLHNAMDSVKDAEARLKILDGCQRTSLLSIMQTTLADVRQNLGKAAHATWQRMIRVDRENQEIRVMERFDSDPQHNIQNTMFVLASLDLLEGRLNQLKTDVESLIFLPRMGKGRTPGQKSIEIQGPVIKSTGERPNPSVKSVLADVSAGFNYFSLIMPDQLAVQFLRVLAPSVTLALIAGPLKAAVPPDLSGVASFTETLSLVKTFADTIGKRKWAGGDELKRWVDNAPEVWLHNRSETTLSSIRHLLSRGTGKSRSVERVETQQVAIEDEAFQQNGDTHDWNASWSDEDGEESPNEARKPDSRHVAPVEDDEDAGAWGFDEDAKVGENTLSSPPETEEEGVDEAEAWGWDDENDPEPSTPARSPMSTRKPPKKSASRRAPPTSREVTLRESYHITAIPEQVLEIIVQAVDDADNLTSTPAKIYNPIKDAGEGLYRLPGLILSMYRACAASTYMHHPAGNMFIYNDSLYLVEQLRAFAKHHATKSASSVLGLAADISTLEVFAKASYGKEMEVQRTVVRDLLDGAQGFTHCTEVPFAEQCELAISSTTERLTSLHGQWIDVLAPSALQQSYGSLLSTVTNKMLIEIEELADISEPESRRLVAFCQRIEVLERLFLPENEREISNDADEEEKEQLTARAGMAASIYTPGLLKFQWLSQILEGTLADIKFWWTESELALAFAPDEVIDLIEALFADSDHRKRAIAEVRRRR